jgi:hypothetical protein
MKNTSKVLLFGVLALMLLIPAALVGAASNRTDLLQQATPTAASAAGADTGATQAPAVEGTPTSPVVELLDQFCVRKVPYSLLAIPEDASFEVVPPAEGVAPPTLNPLTGNTNEIVCTSAGIFGGKQVIACRGPELWSFNLTITDRGESGEFPVPLKTCTIEHFTPSPSEVPEEATAEPTETPAR